ncbi:hypothetical protein ABZP36_021928 [Zizania latifolia]
MVGRRDRMDMRRWGCCRPSPETSGNRRGWGVWRGARDAGVDWKRRESAPALPGGGATAASPRSEAAAVSILWSHGDPASASAPSPAGPTPPPAEVERVKLAQVRHSLLSSVGALVAKALTTSAVPYYQGIAPGQSPVLALDVFLVQASANTTLSHFLGVSSTLELLRSVTLTKVEAAPVLNRHENYI